MWTKFDKIWDRVTFYRSKMIPKYPDSVKWFLTDRHFSKQWSDYNYDNAPHSTCEEEQDLSFQMVIPVVHFLFFILQNMKYGWESDFTDIWNKNENNDFWLVSFYLKFQSLEWYPKIAFEYNASNILLSRGTHNVW